MSILDIVLKEQQRHLFTSRFHGNTSKPATECYRSVFQWSKDDGGDGDNGSCEICKASVRSSALTNQLNFLQAGCSSRSSTNSVGANFKSLC